MKFSLFGKAVLLAGVLSFGGVRAGVNNLEQAIVDSVDYHIRSAHILKRNSGFEVKSPVKKAAYERIMARSDQESVKNTDELFERLIARFREEGSQDGKTVAAQKKETIDIGKQDVIGEQKAAIIAHITQCTHEKMTLASDFLIDHSMKQELERSREKACKEEVTRMFEDLKNVVLWEKGTKSGQ